MEKGGGGGGERERLCNLTTHVIVIAFGVSLKYNNSYIKSPERGGGGGLDINFA